MFQPIVKKSELITDLTNLYGSKITTADVKGYCASHGYKYYTITRYLKDFRNGRGKWNLKVTAKKVAQIEKSFEAPAALPATQQSLIPTKDDTFVQFGSFQDVKKIIQSRLFYPTFITGLSGNGKTFSVEQACASLKRELIRVNITIETDEDDLIGGFRLLNGQTVWHNGPIIEALERGSILLLDEIDLASNKILCLQSILEGKGVFLKKIGRYVKPAPGFNVIATANTKGKGSEDGRFIGTNILNEAFLERFAITIEQPYATTATEKRIVLGSMKKYGSVDEEFATNLVTWAEVIRKTFFDGGVDEVISTRRLDHIVKAFAIFGDKMQSIELCVARFDEDTKASFLDLYTKIDAGVINSEGEEGFNNPMTSKDLEENAF